MGEPRDDATRIDQNVAANVRQYREARALSQDELAERITERGHSFSQATIWKIESRQRPVKISEATALADALELNNLSILTADPEATRHDTEVRWLSRRANTAYAQIKQATEAYLHAQLDLLWAAKAAHDAGVTVHELHTACLRTAPEQAVIEARVEWEQEDQITERLIDEVDRVMQALRDRGYEPKLPALDEVKVEGHGVLSTWTPK
jgi:transcriptional regulator with XRE-family HTH domain